MKRESLCNRFAIRGYLLLLLLMQFGLPALPQAWQSSSQVVPSAIKKDVSRLQTLPQAMKPKSPVFPKRIETETKRYVKPLVIDSISPCYVVNINLEEVEDAIFTITNIAPYPKKGKKLYLEQLAATMGLPAAKPNIALKSDSISVEFIIFKNGWIAALTSTEPNIPGHEAILHAIKKNACVWGPALQEGRPLVYLQRMVIYYSRDYNGNILSLDDFDDRPSANIQKKS
ncbi:hypothetical protein [Sphingobacterium sp. MYb388]|uniref:hypothetical protein n=1 Tax=Sphingobacterium sp. MYb388 TaxID=2745437 RepID=UPI003095CD61